MTVYDKIWACLRCLAWIAVLLVIAGHASKGWALEVIGPAKGDVAPYVHGDLKKGTKLTYQGPKGQYSLELKDNDGKRLVFDNSRGCRYIYNLVPFADSVRNRCSTKKKWGRRSVKLKGALPDALFEGVEYSFETRGKSKSGKAYKTTRNCRVDDAVRIKTVAGEFDTWRVRCQQNANKYTFFAAPDLNTWVAYVFQSGKKKPVVRELVNVSR